MKTTPPRRLHDRGRVANEVQPDEPEVSMRPPIPAILSDLKRIDTAWTALQQQIDQDCG